MFGIFFQVIICPLLSNGSCFTLPLMISTFVHLPCNFVTFEFILLIYNHDGQESYLGSYLVFLRESAWSKSFQRNITLFRATDAKLLATMFVNLRTFRLAVNSKYIFKASCHLCDKNLQSGQSFLSSLLTSNHVKL